MTLERDSVQPLVVEAADIARHVSPDLALTAARRAAAVQLEPETKTGRLTLPLPGGWMRILGAVTPSLGVFGYKEFHLVGSAVRYAIHLFGVDDGRPLGIVDGALLTPLRTSAAAAAAAAAYLGDSKDPADVGIVGSSTEAEAGLRALANALPIGKVRVTSRTDRNRSRFAQRMTQQLGVEVQPVPDVRAVSGDSRVIYIATASGGEVVVADKDLGATPLVLSIGSTLPQQRELAADVLTNASLVVIDTQDVLDESGDAIAAREVGLDPATPVTLGEFLAHPEVVSGGRTVYKSIGSPEQDIVLAASVLEVARLRGFGRAIENWSAVKVNA